MKRRTILGVCTGVVAAALVSALSASPGAQSTMSLAPGTLPRVATVDERYQSYNVEMVEVVGGRFWKPYASGTTPSPGPPAGGQAQPVGLDPSLFEARPPIDLSDPRLRTLASALGPAYIRVSGTWANSVFFQDSDEAAAVAPKGFQSVLTRNAWVGVIQFAKAANARLVSSFAITEGTRDTSGAWTADQARQLLAFTKSAGGEIAAAEFFNEPTFAAIGGAPHGYDAAAFARDFAVFRSFAKATVPSMLIAGPGSVGEGVSLAGGSSFPGLLPTADLLAASPRPVFDVFSYHFYGAVSKRCERAGAGTNGTSPDAALSEEWLSRTETVYQFYARLRDTFSPGTPMWLTETADAACGGNPWAPMFLDTFRYVDQLGRLAARGVKAVFHNTLAASEYGMVDEHSLAPRPKYWAAVLWHRLMGSTVLGTTGSRSGLHLYAQCLPGHAGGVTVLALNMSRTAPDSLGLPVAADRFTLSAGNLDAVNVRLNDHELALLPSGELPKLEGVLEPRGEVTLPPASITFLAMADANNTNCR